VLLPHGDPIEIGNDCVLTYCTILGHDAAPALFSTGTARNRFARPRVAQKRTVIHDQCFIGAQAIVLCGVTIGPQSIVGAGAVVTRDVPPGVVVAGNPARVVGTSSSTSPGTGGIAHQPGTLSRPPAAVKILLVNNQLRLGGAEAVVQQLRRGFRPLSSPSRMANSSRRTCSHSTPSVGTAQPLPPSSRRGMARSAKSLDRSRVPPPGRFVCDLIHLHNFHGRYASIESLAHVAKRKPLVWTFHALWGVTGGCDHRGIAAVISMPVASARSLADGRCQTKTTRRNDSRRNCSGSRRCRSTSSLPRAGSRRSFGKAASDGNGGCITFPTQWMRYSRPRWNLSPVLIGRIGTDDLDREPQFSRRTERFPAHRSAFELAGEALSKARPRSFWSVKTRLGQGTPFRVVL